MFKVVPDQLRISEGWVRCGQCSEVFDASRNLQVLTPPPQSIAARHPVQPQNPKPLPRPGPVSPVIPREGLQEGHAEVSPTNAASGVTTDFTGPGPASAGPMPEKPTDPNPVAASTLLVSEEKASAPRPEDVDALESIFQPEPSDFPAFTGTAPARAARAEDSVLDEDVSFVREARRKAFWQGPWIRSVLLMVALLLLGLFTVQVAVHERDRLASVEPRLKPWLVGLCELAGCRVDVPKQIESVVVDNSSFTRIRSDLFRLGFVIRNTAAVEVSTPAIELTLTDTQDRPVIRRVFRPSEVGSSAVLAPKGEWSAALNLGVAASGDPGRVAGYRLLAFYP
jgi:predicted Zn finger-like uncharacterized protein